MKPRDPLDVFLEDLRHCLKFHHRVKLIETSGRSWDGAEPRVFEASKAPLPATVLVHRTQRSLNLPTPEYRVRVLVTLRRNQLALVERHRSDADSLSMLGALDAEGRTVRSQAIICNSTLPALGTMVTAAMMFSGTSLEAGLRQISRPSTPATLPSAPRPRPLPPLPSVWPKADLEALHFDHAHLGGSLQDRSWRLNLGGSELWLSSVDEAPGFGGGFLLHLRMPRETFRIGERQVSSAELNILAHDFSDAPVFGSWSEDENGYSYRSFLADFVFWPRWMAQYYVAWGLQWMRQARSLAERYPNLPA